MSQVAAFPSTAETAPPPFDPPAMNRSVGRCSKTIYTDVTAATSLCTLDISEGIVRKIARSGARLPTSPCPGRDVVINGCSISLSSTMAISSCFGGEVISLSGLSNTKTFSSANWVSRDHRILQGIVPGSVSMAGLVEIGATTAAVVMQISIDQQTQLRGYEKYTVENWDGHAAQPISIETLFWARRLMKVLPTRFGPPDAAPNVDGSIALEWIFEHGPIAKLFLDIGPGTEWSAYWKRRGGEFGRQPGDASKPDLRIQLHALFEDLSN